MGVHRPFVSLAALCLLAGAGCAISGRNDIGPVTPPPTVYTVLGSPRDLREDVTYPVNRTRQLLRWDDDGFLWQIRFVGPDYAYAGLRFKRGVDGRSDHDKSELRFLIEPVGVSTSLSVGLVDGSTNTARVMVDMPMPASAYSNPRRAMNVRMPLRLFPDRGTAIDGSGGDELPFDWANICEVRIITSGNRFSDRVTIKHLRIVD